MEYWEQSVKTRRSSTSKKASNRKSKGQHSGGIKNTNASSR